MVPPPAPRFYPAAAAPSALPLGRYLPPLPPGMVTAWLAEHVRLGGWVLDPLGATPALPLEAARAGYRVIVACNNPILSFMLETLAAAPRSADFQSAVAEIALAKRGDERIEPHLQGLYYTECPRCAAVSPAHAFLWRKGEAAPFARLVRCPRCGEESEAPVQESDIERMKLPGSDALHRSRAVQRVVMSDDEYREDVEQAVASYLPRPLYALMTLVNKLEGMGLPPARERLLQALLISACDSGSALWPWPAGRARPRQLITPPQFRENNLWMAMEDSIREWTALKLPTPVPVTRWPELPPPGGICLFKGRVKALTPLPSEIGPQAVLAVFPRPNQAFWTLSALWAGWLWGREAALPLRNVLDRRRYDWNWHTTALHSVLSALSRSIPGETPFWCAVPELTSGFLSAVITASETAGFHMQGMALPAETDLGQLSSVPAGALARQLPVPVSRISSSEEDEDTGPQGDPRPEARPAPPRPTADAFELAARAGIEAYLLERGEPAPYLSVYAAALAALARGRAISESPSGISGDLFTRLQAALSRPFADRQFLQLQSAGQNESTAAEDERGWWWLAHTQPAEIEALPLSDRVEIEVIRFMQKKPAFTYGELEDSVYAQFRGLMAPSPDLVRVMCDSYAEPSPAGGWRLKAGESAAGRRADLAEMRGAIEQVGASLGFRVISSSETAMHWSAPGGAVEYSFALMASSLISRFVFPQVAGQAPDNPARRRLLVMPGGRARLLAYKLRRDPRLAEAARAFTVLKFRLLRQATAQPDLSCEGFEALLAQDPLTEDAAQMPLF